MIWQDFILMIAGFSFALALIPTIISKKEKPPVKTCFFTIILLIAVTVCYGSLHLWSAVVSNICTTSCWSVILVQKTRAK